ncbi:hypothetical protein B0I35DRAFT_443836 [Stachybotrys elegans]|uniref:BZIP domain-containing protein n=1 Tax=Stachybotrys elegans TaxID=80388 RepID=A0A8K0WLG6_9HYPO|nr:hypothetical protein B0I35DRAFT_443836 [Stachybotrys elegans]
MALKDPQNTMTSIIPHPRTEFQLKDMSQLIEARGKDDDWTGVTDTKRRRRLQTRLNMRAYRRRQALKAESVMSQEEGVPCWDEDKQAVSILPASRALAFSCRTKGVFPRGASASGIIFPLSADHLIILVQLNTLRAFMTNAQLISANHSYDCTEGALRVIAMDDVFDVPPNLKPTALQTMVPHAAWIDAVPHAAWRNNLILWSGKFDEEDFASDLLGGLYEGAAASECEARGVVVWSPVWHPSGWELSEGFLRKWGWMLWGCEGESLEMTNKWRRSRGEDPLRM